MVRPTIFAEMSALAAHTGALNLGQGFPDEDGPAEVLEAAREAIAHGVNQYPPGRGIPELLAAVSEHQQRFYGISLDPGREVLVTAGATEALAATLLALIDGPDDEVVVFEPYYDSYAAVVALAGARLVTVPLRWPNFQPDLDDLRRAVSDLGARYGVDHAALREKLCMTWAEIDELAADPLATIGAHTVNHVMLRKASDAVVRREMRESAAVIEAALGKRPAHFSYPVGDRTSAGRREFDIAAELGFRTAVTTRPGVLFPEHVAHLTALPRISLNGEYQQSRYAKVLISGAATALWNRFRRVDAA